MTILQDRERQIFSSSMLRLVGYGLLMVAMVNIFLGLMPLQLMNPLWELETIGAVIERLPFILLGIVLIYCQKPKDKPQGQGCASKESCRSTAAIKSFASLRILEDLILKSLSWLSLVAAISLLLVLPLNTANSLRIYHQPDTTVIDRVINHNETTQEFEQQLQTANSIAEIGVVLQQQLKEKINIPDTVDIQKLKTEILGNLHHNQDTITSPVEAFKVQKRSWLIKQCLKWNIGALIGSILFFLVWNDTKWARVEL